VRLLWQRLNRRAKVWLWIITLIGIIAAMPLGIIRMDMESSSDTVEYVFDYRDLEEIAVYESNSGQYVNDKLKGLKEAGIYSMSLYESSLKDLMQSGRLVYYSEKEVAALQGKAVSSTTNHTYVIFTGEEEARAIAPIIEKEFARHKVKTTMWYYDNRPGMIIEESVSAATLKTLDFDPMTIDNLISNGFQIVARFSDRVQPFDAVATEEQLKRLREHGVNRIIFDGSRVKGASDQATLKSINQFAKLLNKYNMGISAIENLKVPQQGMATLAYATNYNVVRLYSLSPDDSFTMTVDGLADRFILAAKDRNIRIFFLNVGLKGNGHTGLLEESVTKLTEEMGGEDGVIAQMEKAGFPSGTAQAFEYKNPTWVKYLRMIVLLGAVAIITLLINAFIPGISVVVFGLGLIGSAGMYILNSSLLEQALALGAAISGPTLGVIWIINRVYARTIGDRRMLGGSEWALGGTTPIYDGNVDKVGLKWIFPAIGNGRRIGLALSWFVVGTCISLCAVPLVFGLLFNITYSLVIDQFRGVSALHIMPIALVLLYIVLYRGNGAKGVIRRLWALLNRPISLVWVLVAIIVAGIGFYYLSRTGNSGQVSTFELIIRRWLESSVGVRPRFKEFVLGHPPLLLGLFLALRYRASWLLIVIGTLGQLTIVSTFTHLHTPLVMSIIRTLLGLGLGLIIGLILIGIWIALEGAWRKWVWPEVIRRIES